MGDNELGTGREATGWGTMAILIAVRRDGVVVVAVVVARPQVKSSRKPAGTSRERAHTPPTPPGFFTPCAPQRHPPPRPRVTVASSNSTAGVWAFPNWHERPDDHPGSRWPVMVTTVPPSRDPLLGSTLVKVALCLYVNAAVLRYAS